MNAWNGYGVLLTESKRILNQRKNKKFLPVASVFLDYLRDNADQVPEERDAL
jgi:hypothetical protein